MLETKIAIAAERRSDTGKGAARKLRAAGRVPGVVYGPGRSTEMISLSAAEFEKTMHHQSLSAIIDLQIDGSSTMTIIREVQRHPVRQNVEHIDFLEITEGVELTVTVPIHLTGSAEGVRMGGVLDQPMRELSIQVLPRHMPASIDVDVTSLSLGKSIHVSDLVVENVRILDDPKMTVCSVAAPKVHEEEVEVEAEEEAAEPELIRKPKEDEESAESE